MSTTPPRHDTRDNRRAFTWGIVAVIVLVVAALFYFLRGTQSDGHPGVVSPGMPPATSPSATGSPTSPNPPTSGAATPASPATTTPGMSPAPGKPAAPGTAPSK